MTSDETLDALRAAGCTVEPTDGGRWLVTPLTAAAHARACDLLGPAARGALGARLTYVVPAS